LEQPKKPGANRDIADLKARLGLIKGPAPGAAAPPPGAPSPFPAPPQAAPAFPGAPAAPPAAHARQAIPVSSPAHPALDPYASMRPPPGRTFDLRAVDDGVPAANVRSRGGVFGFVMLAIAVMVGGGVGYGFGAAAVGRRAFNQANAAARKIKTELEEMQKTVTQIGTAAAMSQQRLTAEKKDMLAYDPRLIADLEKVKLDPRPDTTRIFKTDYARLEDLAVDRLMSYYYDTIALYSEVERHIKRTHADQQALEAFAGHQQAKAGAYGVVFDSRGKVTIGTLVEVGAPVCGKGTTECPPDKIEGFQIRANTGSAWSSRKIGPKPMGDSVVPIDKTPLFEAVMSGSPDQVRMEQYRSRYNNIRLILTRLAAEKKELFEAIQKASERGDLFTF
jgi:hypothetical protein